MGATDIYAAAKAAEEKKKRKKKAPLTRTPSSSAPISKSAPTRESSARKRRTKARVEQTNRTKKLKVDVPEIVPPELRKTVAKQGQRLNDALKEAGSDLSGPEYLAKLIQFESGWDKNAEGPPIAHLGGDTAKGLAQTISGTAKDLRERLGTETQDPSKPKKMVKGAALHASGKEGYGPLYAGYNPGYSKDDPIPSVPSGKNVAVKVNKRKAKRLAGGKPSTKGNAPSPVKGPYEGSQKIIKELIGEKYAAKADWKDKEDRGGSGSFHDYTNKNAFAADIAIDEAGLSTEKLVDRIAKKLGLDPKDVNYGTKGLESGISYKGYDIQFLPYDHGSGPHVHIGAKWTGGSSSSHTPSPSAGGGSDGNSSAPGKSSVKDKVRKARKKKDKTTYASEGYYSKVDLPPWLVELDKLPGVTIKGL